MTFTLSTFDDEIHMTLAVRCGRSSILRQNLDKFFKHNNKCGMGPHVWPLGTYHVKYAPITFKYQHFRLFFLKKDKIPRMQEVVYKVIRCTYLLQWAILWWLTLVKQNRPFTKWLFLQIGLSENLLNVVERQNILNLEG